MDNNTTNEVKIAGIDLRTLLGDGLRMLRRTVALFAALLADASELAVLADGALMTVRQNYASRAQIMEGAQVLSDSRLPILGSVLNYAASRSPYGGYYGYGYGGYGRAYGEKKEPTEN